MKKFLAIFLLATISLFSQPIFEETFDGDSINGNWGTIDLDSYLVLVNETARAAQSCCGAGQGLFNRTAIYADSVNEVSTGNVDLDVRGYIWKANAVGTESIMLGFWQNTNHFIGFFKNHTEAYAYTVIGIRYGGLSYEWLWKQDITSTIALEDSTTYLRVTYTVSDTTIRFMSWNGSDWDTLNTYGRDLGNIQYRIGARWAMFNTSGSSVKPTADSLWAQFLPDGVYALDLDYPTNAAIVINAGDTLDVLWTGDSTVMAPYVLYFSDDNGSTYTLVDTVAEDGTYEWIAPNLYIEQAKFLVTSNDSTYSDDSDNAFLLLPYSSLNIIYPIEKTNQTFYPGDTLHVNVESMYVNDIWLYWSKDSTNWTFIDSMAVDTVNAQYMDSTTFVWTFDGSESGPTIWIKVEEQADTNLYVFERDFNNLGTGYPLGTWICQIDNGGTFIEHFYLYDPSCGWTQPPHRYYTMRLGDLGESRYGSYNGCVHPYTDPGCTYPLITPVYLTASDTVATYMNDFYSDYGAAVTYQSRTYYVTNETLYSDDLINGIDSIVVSDLSSLYGAPHWFIDGTEILQVYHVQISKISGDTLATTTDWESLNDTWFNPKILIGMDTPPDVVITVDALPYPNDANPSSDTEKILTGASIQRHFFRGIHPKIDKDR